MLDEQTENQHIQGLTLCLVSLSHPYIPSGGVVDMDGASYMKTHAWTTGMMSM